MVLGYAVMAQKGQIFRRPGPMSGGRSLHQVADHKAAKALGVDWGSKTIQTLKAFDLSSIPPDAWVQHKEACFATDDHLPTERAKVYESCPGKIISGTLVLVLRTPRQEDGGITHLLYTADPNDSSEDTEDEEEAEPSAAKAKEARRYENCVWTLYGRYFDPTFNDYNNPH
jgi:hypothetical protein